MSLRLSTFENLNDLNEADINCEWSDSINHYKIKEYIKKNCKLASFTRSCVEKSFFGAGYNHPRMWAQYASNNTGACIVINQKSLKRNNKKNLNGVFNRLMYVKYRQLLYDKDIKDKGEARNFIETNYQHIFFKKHIDWEHEYEKRFICIEGPEYLSIKNCIEFIILGRNFSDEKYFDLAKLMINSKFGLIPFDFAKQVNSNGRISVEPDTKILEKIMDIKKTSNDYVEFLRKSGIEI